MPAPRPDPAEQLAEWLPTFRHLTATRDAAEWALVDYVASARQGGAAIAAGPLATALDVSRVRVANHTRLARAFPPDCRDARLSFDVHVQLACLPDDLRFSTLATAASTS